MGFDLSDGGLAIARKAGRAVAKGDVTRIPIASDSCDVVASFDVLAVRGRRPGSPARDGPRGHGPAARCC